MEKDWVVCGVVDDFEVLRDRLVGDPRRRSWVVDGNLDVIHSQLLDCRFLIVLHAEIDDRLDSLLFQEFKTFFVGLTPSIQTIGQHLKSGNIVRGREIRPCQRSRSGQKMGENNNAFKHAKPRIHEKQILGKWLWAWISAD